MKNKKLRMLSLGSILNLALGESVYQFQSTFVATVWPVWAIGFANTFAHFAAAFSYFISTFILNKFTRLNFLLLDNLLSRVFTFIALIKPTFISPIILGFSSFLFGTRMVAENSLLQDEFSTEQRATMGSINSLVSNIFFGIIMLILGKLSDLLGPSYALLIIECFLFINSFIYFRLIRKDTISSMQKKFSSQLSHPSFFTSNLKSPKPWQSL